MLLVKAHHFKLFCLILSFTNPDSDKSGYVMDEVRYKCKRLNNKLNFLFVFKSKKSLIIKLTHYGIIKRVRESESNSWVVCASLCCGSSAVKHTFGSKANLLLVLMGLHHLLSGLLPTHQLPASSSPISCLPRAN
jgi:hypothetical protein